MEGMFEVTGRRLDAISICGEEERDPELHAPDTNQACGRTGQHAEGKGQDDEPSIGDLVRERLVICLRKHTLTTSVDPLCLQI